MTRPSVIAVTGPTAVGKSAVADLIAEKLGVPVISADAMQVYRGMDIGTAKTPVSERRVPLLMVDVADPGEAYSAALYQSGARTEIDRVLARGRQAVLCGGTGLYLRAALDEMTFPAGEVSGARRGAYQELANELGSEGLHRELVRRDPRSAAVIHPNNVRRVVRALEMLDEGVSYADQRAGFSAPRERYGHRDYALTMDRDELYRRIDARVDAMIDRGLVDEVRALMDAGVGDALTSRQAIGYKEVIDYLVGRSSLDDAVDLIKRRSRRYAKRQLSWCRRDPRMIWLDMDELGVDGAAARILKEVGA